MEAEQKYYDMDGNEVSLHRLVSTDPGWAENRIRHMTDELSRLREDNARLQREVEGLEASYENVLNDWDEATIERDRLSERVRELENLRRYSRTNLERTDNGLRVCWGDHERADDCDWEYYVPAERVRELEKAGRSLADEYQRVRKYGCEGSGGRWTTETIGFYFWNEMIQALREIDG